MSFIKPYHYHSPDVFAEEYQNIFGSQWLFACMTEDVAEQKDYFVFELMGKSVIIYNSRDGLKAFQNVCPHRFNLIFTDEKGNSPLFCKYHAWGFDQNGKLIGKDKKNISPSPVNLDVCLKRYELAVVGKFVFVNLSSSAPISIDEQLGELHDELITVSEAFDEKVHERSIPHRANWKFIVENVVDFQHCKTVHEETFVTIGGCTLPPDEQFRVKHNSYFSVPPPPSEGLTIREKFMRKHFPRKIENNNYKHIFVFPNLTVSVSEGFHFSVGQLLPADADNTIYNLRFYIAGLINPKPTAPALAKEFAKGFPPFADRIFAEDIVYLENLQRGVKEVEHSGFVYRSEQRINWFFQSYEELMGERSVSKGE